LLLLPVAAGATPYVHETLTLTNGWNAVYIECTPTNALCDEFFANTPVISAAAYRSDADASTAQYDASGNEIVQAPVVYLQWVRGKTGSTLQSIAGGGTYLLFATNTATKDIYGVPSAPKMTWRKVSSAETNEYFNLVGVSSAEATVPIDAYFGEGPFGLTKSGRSICAISGMDETRPVLKSAEGSFGRQTPVASGKAYALTSTCDGEWPGVIGVQGSAVYFGPNANYASIKIQNCGTTNHTFTIKMERSEPYGALEPPPISRRLPRVDALSEIGYTNVEENVAWSVSLEPDEISEQIFSLDRSQLGPGMERGAILTIEDPAGSKMRVRLPIYVAPVSQSVVAYPTGLWIGEIALTQVSGLNDETPTPVKAGGQLKMSVMMHVDSNGTCRLLQRVAAGMDTNGTARLFKELANVPAEIEAPKRFSTVMMSVDTPVVAAAGGSAFGDEADFTWTIAPTARDNPFRHAWHPDHDGKKADYLGEAPSGDDFANYASPVKPELWSISNRLFFSWHEQGIHSQPINFEYNASETTSGVVTWEVTGLIANKPIKSEGTFTLKRAVKAAELEE
jgi:hypothetical protein